MRKVAVDVESSGDATGIAQAKGGGKGKTALVLSAGGMFGSYQAGVWRVLQDAFEPDIIVGASIGALNGWLIAGGCSSDELARRWYELGQAPRPRWRIPSYFSDGLIDTEPVEAWIRDIYNRCTPRVEFGAVATQMRTMRPHLFRWPQIDWKHLCASCAVPLFLRQCCIDGKYFADGGLLDHLPIWAAIELGASRIVAVDLLPYRPRIIRAVVRCARAYGRFSAPCLENVCISTIRPSQPLGGPRDSIYWTRENTGAWIRLGEKDALASKHLVIECLEHP